MAFVQIIEFRTAKIAEMRAVGDEWEKATEGKRKAGRRVLCQDRDNPGRYFNIVFFDSYEEAMENSNRDDTTKMAGEISALCDSQSFTNFDLLDELHP